MLKIYQKKIELDKKTVADMLFLESVSGFLDLSNRESMQILRDNLNHLKDFKVVITWSQLVGMKFHPTITCEN